MVGLTPLKNKGGLGENYLLLVWAQMPPRLLKLVESEPQKLFRESRLNKFASQLVRGKYNSRPRFTRAGVIHTCGLPLCPMEEHGITDSYYESS